MRIRSVPYGSTVSMQTADLEPITEWASGASSIPLHFTNPILDDCPVSFRASCFHRLDMVAFR